MKKVLISLGVLLLSTNLAYAEDNFQTSILSDEEIKSIIEKGVTWLVNSQEKNGHFRYEYMPFWNRYSLDENMVRQAGALYILGEIAKKDVLPEMDLKKSLEKAIGYFEANSLVGEFNGYKFRCLKKTSEVCTLGGTSLALLGVLDFVEKYPDLQDQYTILIEDYKNFILAMKVNNKGFRTQYYFAKEQTLSESPFGNGEAILALVRYYLMKPSEELKQLIEQSMDYFVGIYRAEWDNNFYLWGMAAIKDWYTLFPEQKHYNFVKNYTDWRIGGQKSERDTTHNKCAYIEGVVSAYSVLEKDLSVEEQEFYLEEINFWLKKSEKLQIKKSDTFGVSFSDGSTKILKIKKPSKAVGGFLTDEYEPYQRIDFTQHCLSSYLQKLVDISM